jgi:hypothetical protein
MSRETPDHDRHCQWCSHSWLLAVVAVFVLGSILGCSSPPAAKVGSVPATTLTGPAPTTSSVPSTSVTSVPATTATSVPATQVPSGQFSVLAPGAALPSDATCAARVKPTPEIRAGNAQYNATRGSQKNLTGPYPLFSRVDGNFTGTTDEIIQWTACKWGVDPDVVRAQAVVESYWHQTTLGDTTSNATVCAPHHPIGSDPKQPGVCPESVGLLQVRYQFWKNGFDEVETSTAYNSDYVYAAWRSCYEGQETWLNTVDHVGTYGPGDVWGCLGVWFSGQWHTTPAEQYIAKVKAAFQDRPWTQSSFAQG